MDDSYPLSSQTLSSSPRPRKADLDLSHCPPIFVSATYFDTDDLHDLEDDLAEAGATLTYDAQEAGIVITKVLKPKRVQFDLRAKGVWTEEVKAEDVVGEENGHVKKRRKLCQAEKDGRTKQAATPVDDESTESESETAAKATRKEEDAIDRPRRHAENERHASRMQSVTSLECAGIIDVVRLDWFEQSRQLGKVLPLHDFLVLRCRRIERPLKVVPPKTGSSSNLISTTSLQAKTAPSTSTTKAHHIIARAKEDASQPSTTADHFGKRQFGSRAQAPSSATSWSGGHSRDHRPAHLLHKTTTEDDENGTSDLPPMPDWVKAGIKYACQRSTPRDSPNRPFIEQLKKIRTARLLTNDEIGVRAYSTSIAALAAYPNKIQSPREIIALPGCDAKIANLFVEYTNSPSGTIQAVTDLETDPDLQILSHFYNIWGVGATRARDLYFGRGWRDLDDIVEYGWSTLSRVQQIGVKYYEEFLDPIPRAEVAQIAAVIHAHAVKVRDEGIQSLLVGGYRRGKEACGDVDIIVSHPDESQTADLITDLVSSLEDEDCITHTLLLSLQSTQRGQQTLPLRRTSGGGGATSGSSHSSGFDTLDKALVVWQDPSWSDPSASSASVSSSAVDDKKTKRKKNPNIHRRVDIIIAPWRSVGCAVLSWSGETTFQRDLRRFCKDVKGWKFDSSGVREYGSGEVVEVDFEGGLDTRRRRARVGERDDEDGENAGGKRGKALLGMEEAERRVFEALGLEYRRPEERCTG
ncbi:DNA polymerase beta-like protein [Hortaea werneckii]|nr:DNA polymerase beta-like protein [Hortaea werneckii]KAI6991233.1 DNA polymerase beta-like protein [Hortaea werneckii]KAI7144220.1 DNA polymerase beta-like protein [Hortaea werneckii]KAI7172130.1 DNA polymerase beta-like protein [Hortaea werneckii]